MESEELELVMDDAESSMQKAISHLETELIKIRAGKANPTMVDGIFADILTRGSGKRSRENIRSDKRS